MLGESFRARLTAGSRTPNPLILVRIQCPEPYSAMKFDLQLETNEDLERFRVMYYKLLGTDQTQYNFYTGNVMVRISTTYLTGSQVVEVRFFSYNKEERDEHTNISLTQFHPLSDNRFREFKCVRDLWAAHPDHPSAAFVHTKTKTDEGFETIRNLLRYVYKFNKLKAFL